MMKTANNKNKLRIVALALLGFGATLAFAVPAGADSKSVVVTASNASKLTMTLSTNTSDFGSGLDPTGAGAVGDVVSYNDQPNGAYYVKKGDANFAQTVTVNSNAAWNGSAQAAERVGTSGMTIAGGSLRWKSGNMSSLPDAQGGSAFTTTPDTNVFGTGPQPKGANNTYNFDYSLRVLWTDDPGTFSSTVTYSAQQ
jgi:hypothetical protein